MTVLVASPHLADEGVRVLEAAGCDVHFLEAFPPPAHVAEAGARLGAAAIIARQGRITAAVIDALPELRIIARHGAGTDEVDLDAARARGLLVTRTPGANARAVAEHAITTMLLLVKDIPALQRRVAAGGWRDGHMKLRDVAGMRLGLIGMGPIGQETARLATAFGMTVAAFSRRAGDTAFRTTRRAASLDALLAETDILSLHSALTDETRAMLDARALALLPRGALIVNTARGGLIDEAALLAALDSGHIAGAALDVTAIEPPAADHPFRRHPAVVLTPHIAGVTEGSMAQMAKDAAECVVAALTGGVVPADRIVVAAR
jgi:D-3-phosphoglycerate dehydrogenase / 2-oxoglutarate reductase